MCLCDRVKFKDLFDVIVASVIAAIEAIEPSVVASESLTDGTN